VFNPYAKTTKTSILFLDKEMQEKIQGVEFVKVDNDGFDLGATRTPIQDNDLPTALEIINLHKKGVSNSGHNLQHKLLSREEIGNRPAANWAVFNDYYENTSNSSIHQNTEIGSILIPKKAKITIDNDTEYKQITVKMNGKGAVLRKKILGKDIKTKAQFLASEGDFIMSKIDARNGAFSIVPDFLDGSVVTSDFPIFNVNKEIMAEDFLKIMLQSPQFIKICKITSVGTSNRKRIKIQKFLNSKIPLPTLNDQQMIISELAVHRKRVEIKKQEILEEEQKISDKITEVWGE
jgi:restriction endonuclease S subunit